MSVPAELLLETEPTDRQQAGEIQERVKTSGEELPGKNAKEITFREKITEPGSNQEALPREVQASAPAQNNPPPVARPGLAAQINEAAESFEQGRQQLLGGGKEKPTEQQSAIPAEIAETFAEVYELLQCR